MAVDTVQCELLSVFKFPLTGKNTGNFSTEIALPIKLASVHARFSEFFIQLQESETGNSWRRNREICFSNSARGSGDGLGPLGKMRARRSARLSRRADRLATPSVSKPHALAACTVPLRHHLVRRRVDARKREFDHGCPHCPSAECNLPAMARNSGRNLGFQSACCCIDARNCAVSLVEHPDRPRASRQKAWLRANRSRHLNLIRCRIHAHQHISRVRCHPH